MTYATAFPDFPASDLPAIPAAWLDTSWHNDACPSFEVISAGPGDATAPFGRIRVWVNYAASDRREFTGQPRFAVAAEGVDSLDLLQTDDWQSVLDYCGARADLGQRYVAAVGYNPFLDCPTIDLATVTATLAELES